MTLGLLPRNGSCMADDKSLELWDSSVQVISSDVCPLLCANSNTIAVNEVKAIYHNIICKTQGRLPGCCPKTS